MNEVQRPARHRRPRARAAALTASAALVAAQLLGVTPAASFGEDRLEHVSEGPGGLPGNLSSTVPVVAADDPDIVAFESRASNLVAGDTNSVSDIFVNDSGVVRRITAEFDGGSDGATQPSISADGRFVAFVVTAGDVEFSTSRVFVKDVVADTPAQIMPTIIQTGDQTGPALSPDGGFLAWEEQGLVVVRDWRAAVASTVLVSATADGELGGCCSRHPSVSEGATAVAFESTAALEDGDVNGNSDVYVRRDPFSPAGTTTLLSRPSPGLLGNGPSGWPSIRHDGSEVAFHSFATNLVVGDDNAQPDVFVAGPGGVAKVTTGPGAAVMPSVSDDARYVAYLTGSPVGPPPAIDAEFDLVLQSGGLVPATGIVGLSGTDVTVAFPAGSVAGAVGATSDEGAVIDYQIRPLDVRQGRSNANPPVSDGNGPASTGPPGSTRLHTDAPDLLSVETVAGGDTAIFCFDEDVITGNRGFGLVDDNSAITRMVEPVDVIPFSGDPACVGAEFPFRISEFELGFALAGAVRGQSGEASSPGGAPVVLTATVACPVVPGPPPVPFVGRTTRPDVTSARRVGDSTAFDFAVDEPLDTLPAVSGFGFHDGKGTVHRGESITANPACFGRASYRVDFGPAAPVGEAGRFFVDAGALVDVSGEQNVPLSSADDTPFPDLVSVDHAGGSDPPAYRFVFDDEVRSPVATSFALRPVDGEPLVAASASVDPPGSSTVLALFPDLVGFTDQIVVGTVAPGAVAADADGQASTLGSVVVDTPDPEPTDGPDLVAAVYDTVADTVTYRFDEPVRDARLFAPDVAMPGAARVVVRDRVTARLLPGVIEPLPAPPLTEGRPSLSGNGRHVAFDARLPAPVNPQASTPPPPRDQVLRADLLFAVLTPPAHDYGEVTVGASGVRRVLLGNDGFGPLVAGAPSIVGSPAFTVVANGCTGVPVLTSQTCPVDIAFTPAVGGEATATLSLPDNALGSPRTVDLRGVGRPETPPDTVPDTVPDSVPDTVPLPTYAPVLQLNPGIGPPGTVTEVAGSGFPPGASIVLSWSGGFGKLPTASVTASPEGTFRDVAMLVFHRDQLGPRKITADVAGHPDLHPETAFLVVPSQVDAPGFVVRR